MIIVPSTVITCEIFENGRPRHADAELFAELGEVVVHQESQIEHPVENFFAHSCEFVVAITYRADVQAERC